MAALPIFTVRDWHNRTEALDTPISATALEQAEQRLSDYALAIGEQLQSEAVDSATTLTEYIVQAFIDNPPINVKDYGAVGDGVTDDTDAIQAALDDAINFDFQSIEFPAGTYLVSTLTLTMDHSGIRLFSQGGTIINNIDNYGTQQPLIDRPQATARAQGYLENFIIEGLIFQGTYTDLIPGDLNANDFQDGIGPPNYQLSCIEVCQVDNFVVRNCEFKDFSSSAIAFTDPKRIWVNNNRTYNCAQQAEGANVIDFGPSGILDTTSDEAERFYVCSNDVDTFYAGGIVVRSIGTSIVQRSVITDNIVRNGPIWTGIYIEGYFSQENVIANNQIYDCLVGIGTSDTQSYSDEGNWNASTNSPSLADLTGTSGDEYTVTTGATRDLGSGSQIFVTGDHVRYNGQRWRKIEGGIVTRDNIITGNLIISSVSGAGAYGLQVSGSYNTITGNRVKTPGTALHLHNDTNTARPKNVTITGNILESTTITGAAVSVEYSDDSLVVGNRIYSGKDGLAIRGAVGLLLASNAIEVAATSGARAIFIGDDLTDTVITNNKIKLNGNSDVHGIRFQGGYDLANVLIEGNQILGICYAYIRSDAATTSKVFVRNNFLGTGATYTSIADEGTQLFNIQTGNILDTLGDGAASATITLVPEPDRIHISGGSGNITKINQGLTYGAPIGRVVILSVPSGTTLKKRVGGSDNLRLSADYVGAGDWSTITLVAISGNWQEVARSSNP